ncbi:MAG TPA: polysaccharide deacetylase family protein [Candidatus Acidoferrum sp.]|nr:polysaccharide deacetylase family protein [Candidatus Acidoferrum sp.]
MRRFRSLLLMVLAAAGVRANAQTAPRSLAERLGYPGDAKLLIVHADDLGMTHSVNAASIKGLETGLVNSASIMVPCPWFPEIADYAKAHPETDFGIHLTLTSERVFYRWGPVAPRDKIPSLVDSNGYFHLDWTDSNHINPQEAELELRAQIEKALAMGVRPTHLDSHQYRLFTNGKELFQSLLRVAHDYKLPVFMVRDWFAERPYLEAAMGSDDLVVDHTVTMNTGVPPEKWASFYAGALKNLQPGVTVFIIHLAFDDEEMRAGTRERATWGAAWRQRDFDYFTSTQFRTLLREQNIKLVTWRELAHASK